MYRFYRLLTLILFVNLGGKGISVGVTRIGGGSDCWSVVLKYKEMNTFVGYWKTKLQSQVAMITAKQKAKIIERIISSDLNNTGP